MSIADQGLTQSFCLFQWQRGLFALPSTSVLEVVAHPVIVAIPHSPPILAGICHARNEFLPVLQLDGSREGSDSSPQQLLVVNGGQVTGGGGNWGLVIERVQSLEMLEVVNHVDPQGSGEWTSSMAGSAHFQNAVVNILNPAAMYRIAESQLKYQPEVEMS